MLSILIIDEHPAIAASLKDLENKLDIVLFAAHSLSQGFTLGERKAVDVIFMRDVIAGVSSGDALNDFQQILPGAEILLYSDRGDEQQAENALNSGVWDYVVSPNLEQTLPDILRRVIRYCRNKKEDFETKEEALRQQLQHYGIIGSSSTMQNCLNLVAKLGQSDASVLINGETGTGKELFASAIHNISKRNGKKLVVVDCAALPTTLVESILFGHVRGSFTGAEKTQQGLIKKADGGTLFLDEVAEMPLEIQKKFLRVLQEMNFYQVGSTTPQKSDFRLIAATNKDLETMVAEGRFRKDLLFRLKTFQLELPPLRNRKTDITELVYHLRLLYCRKHKLKKKKLTTDYLAILNRYEWPGNVRELFQAVEFSLESAQQSEIIDTPHLPVNIRLAVTKKSMQEIAEHTDKCQDTELPDQLSAMPTMKEDRELAVEKQEKRYLQRLLQLSEGHIKKCCETSGLSRSRLYYLMKKHGLNKNSSLLTSTEK
nr:sigma-54 dependent transcriptional regulator [uncultured Desulfobulbus sp.]